MVSSDLTLLKSLIVVAWADGKVAEEETALIESMINSFRADAQESMELREFASTRRNLDDVPLDELDEASRRRLLQLAVLVSYVDGVQDEDELALLHELADRLGISPEERMSLMQGSEIRAKGLLRALQA